MLLASSDDKPPPSGLISRARRIKGRNVTAIVTASDCATKAAVITVKYPETGPEPIPNKENYEGVVQAHPDAELLFEEDTALWVKADLAVIFLTKEVKGIAPVRLTGAEVQEGDRIMLVGYGMSEVTNLERRFGETWVSQVRKLVSGGVEFVARAQYLEDGGLASQLILGDSGGGCFRLDAPTVLVGVNASTSRNIWDQVSSIFTSVSAYSGWLQQQIEDPRAGRAPR